VPVAALVRNTGAARSLHVHSSTGYWIQFPIGDLERLLLATRAGGAPVSVGHGFPARLVAPGRCGFWWVSGSTASSCGRPRGGGSRRSRSPEGAHRRRPCGGALTWTGGSRSHGPDAPTDRAAARAGGRAAAAAAVAVRDPRLTKLLLQARCLPINPTARATPTIACTAHCSRHPQALP
jgi:Oxidoreductase molybdopterin binding domain